MKTYRLIVVSVLLVITWSASALADQYADTIALFKKADAVMPFFENCHGYAVFPTIGKGGIGIGGAYGTGQVYAQGVPTGTAKMFKGTIGFQLGGQVFHKCYFTVILFDGYPVLHLVPQKKKGGLKSFMNVHRLKLIFIHP